MSLDALFDPFRCGRLEVQNRFVMAPMTRWMSPNQYPGANVADYYRRRAEHGVGLIITEGTTIDHAASSHSERTPAFHGPALDGWRRVVDGVHAAGSKVVPQLWHVGAMRHPAQDIPNPDQPYASPSGLRKAGGKPVYPPSSTAEIQQIIDSFVRAAVSAREIGYDGIEIHGAHGYLLDQFLWDDLNKRSDAYGGDSVARTRFAVDLIARVRVAVGRDFPIILRVSQWKQQNYDARLATTPDALATIFRPISDAGVDIFHCSQRRYWEPEFEGSPLNLASWIKQLLGKPVITVGSVGLSGAMSVSDIGESADATSDLQPLADGVVKGDFDLVAVGRALLSDAEWVEKVRKRDFGALRSFNKKDLETLL